MLMDMDTKLMLMEANIHGYYQGVKDTIKAVLKMAYDMSEIDGEHFTEPHMVVDVEDIQKLLPAVKIEDIEPKTKKFMMRDATPEEQKSVDDYVKSISKLTGVDFEALLEQEPTTRKSCETCIGKSRYVDGMDLCEDCEECSNFKPKQTEETIGKYVEQEPCDDVISRQAVLDLIEHYNSDGLGSVFYGFQEGVKFAGAVNKLPSVIPKSETVTEFADRCRECGARYGKLLKQQSCNDEDARVKEYAKAFHLGMALGFAAKYDERDKIIEEVKKAVKESEDKNGNNSK